MASDTENPTDRAIGRAPKNVICLVAIASEHNPPTLHLQDLRAAWLARRAKISANLAATLAPLAFGQEAR